MDGALTVGIIGCGNMGTALVENIKEKLKPAGIFVLDKDRAKAESVANRFQVNVCRFIDELISNSGVIIVAVKPQDFDELLKTLKGVTGKVVISIAAGIKIAHMESLLGRDVAVVRAMPNLNALIAKSVTALCCNRVVSQGQKEAARCVFQSVGDVVFVEEEKINAVTAVSGSGPAFVAYLIKTLDKKIINDVLRSEAIRFGIDASTAAILADATIYGTEQMLAANLDPEMLIKRVASKGGTTEAGLKVLEAKGKTKEGLSEAIRAAERRAAELSQR